MEKLEKKTFYTIFSIISLFIVISIIVFNVQSYHKEYNGIKTNLTRMNMMVGGRPNRKPINQNFDDLNNKVIMDYDFYTFILETFLFPEYKLGYLTRTPCCPPGSLHPGIPLPRL